MKEKSLEQLTQHLRKALPKESHPYLDELINRASTAYVQAEINEEFAEAKPVGSLPAKDLQHVEDGSLFIVGLKTDAGRIAHLAARKRWDDTVEVEGAEKIRLPITDVNYFIPLARTYGNLTRESLILKLRAAREQIANLQEMHREQNIELDALGYVWCTGNCNGGQFAYTEPQEITSEMLAALAGTVARLIARGANTTNDRLARNIEFFNSRRDTFIERTKAIDTINERVRAHRLKLLAYNEATRLPEEKDQPKWFKAMRKVNDFVSKHFLTVIVPVGMGGPILIDIIRKWLCGK